jgi:GntR family transcriptional regulator/MocR family aminotransferase
MLPFETLVKIDKRGATPLYQQIANSLSGLIRSGVLKPGAALPPSREMSQLLRVHRKTVVAAYHELFAQDWVETVPRKGVLVSQRLPEIKPRLFRVGVKTPAYAGSTGFSFNKVLYQPAWPERTGSYRLMVNDGFPDPRIAPVDLLMRTYRGLSRMPALKRMSLYGNPQGALSLRTALAQFLGATRGLNMDEQNILVTHGAQMAIYIAAQMILKPGATVVTGSPNYFLADMVFHQTGARIVRVPVDEQGMDVEALARICKKKRPDLLYIIPHHHHPTTVTLSADRRMMLLELIRQYRLPVIEDDYDYDFHYSSSPILPLASADHGGQVIYIGSLTKSLDNTIRKGYMIAPADFIREAVLFRRMIDIRDDSLLEEALAVLFTNGDIARHLKKSLKLYHERRDHLCQLMEEELKGIVSFRKPAGGLALWAQFRKEYTLPAVAARAAKLGLFINSGVLYNTDGADYNALRIGFASLNEKEMKEMTNILRKAV